jgi:hypothetical protein
MEKWIVFGPMIIFFGFFALLVFGFLFLVAKLFIKGKNESWTGEVIDKKYVEKDKEDSHLKEHFFSLRVRLDNGEEHNIPATVEFYNKIKVGDRLEKKKGELWPKKIS